MHEEDDESDHDSYNAAHNQHANNNIGRRASEDDNTLLNHDHTATEEGVHPGRQWGPLSTGGANGVGHVAMPPLPQVDTDTEYRGTQGQSYHAPSAMSPSSYQVDSPAGNLGFHGRPSPVTEYEEYKGGAGGRYSFSGR